MVGRERGFAERDTSWIFAVGLVRGANERAHAREPRDLNAPLRDDRAKRDRRARRHAELAQAHPLAAQADPSVIP